MAVAEELHFGRAARRLHITQPPLSRQIRLLEHAVGADLFLRSSRVVQLTQPGLVLLPEAQRILRLVESAGTMVRDVAAGRSGVLRCGFTAAAAYAFLPPLLMQLKSAIPGAALVLKEMVSRRQLEALDRGELDVALLRPPVDRTANDLVCVAREKLLVAMPRGHPLGRGRKVAWAQLDGVPLIMYDTKDASYFNDLVVSHLTTQGVSPLVDHRLGQIHSILSLVRVGVGCAIVPDSARLLEAANVDYRPFATDAPVAELMLTWRRENRNPLVRAFVELASGGAKD